MARLATWVVAMVRIEAPQGGASGARGTISVSMDIFESLHASAQSEYKLRENNGSELPGFLPCQSLALLTPPAMHVTVGVLHVEGPHLLLAQSALQFGSAYFFSGFGTESSENFTDFD